MVEMNKKIWIALAVIVGVLLILIPLLSWVGGDGMEATFEHLGFEIPEGFYPGIDLGWAFQDYLWAIIVPIGMFTGIIGIYILIKKVKETKTQ